VLPSGQNDPKSTQGLKIMMKYTSDHAGGSEGAGGSVSSGWSVGGMWGDYSSLIIVPMAMLNILVQCTV